MSDTYQDRGLRDSNMRAYRHSTHSKQFLRQLRRPSSGAAERRRAEAEAVGGSRPAEAGHRKPAEEEVGSNPAGADRSPAEEHCNPAEGSL